MIKYINEIYLDKLNFYKFIDIVFKKYRYTIKFSKFLKFRYNFNFLFYKKRYDFLNNIESFSIKNIDFSEITIF